MTTQEFIDLLKAHPGHSLTFEYQAGRRLRPDYHITEVKNVRVEATDCGGRSDAWKETVIQLWEAPGEDPGARQITSRKALGILDRVARSQPLFTDDTVRFEYGNAHFHTSQMHVAGATVEDGQLVVRLSPEATQCKASELCGIPAETPNEVSACLPGSGCC